MGASETPTALAGLAEAFGLPFNLVDPLLKIHDRATKRYDHQPESLVVADLPGGTVANDLLNAERPRPCGLVDVKGQQIVDSAHKSSPLRDADSGAGDTASVRGGRSWSDPKSDQDRTSSK